MLTDSKKERRDAVRKPTEMRGTLESDRGSRMAVDIVDLSTAGFSAELGHNAVLDSTGFEVNLGGLEPLGAELRWAGRTDAGFRFERPLHPAVFDHLVERNKPRGD
jgi:hypothetical protein